MPEEARAGQEQIAREPRSTADRNTISSRATGSVRIGGRKSPPPLFCLHRRDRFRACPSDEPGCWSLTPRKFLFRCKLSRSILRQQQRSINARSSQRCPQKRVHIGLAPGMIQGNQACAVQVLFHLRAGTTVQGKARETARETPADEGFLRGVLPKL